jgi:lipopolysaccharide transport system ATP-binding protein
MSSEASAPSSSAIVLRGASKVYPKSAAPGRRLWDALRGVQPRQQDDFVALQACDLEIAQGDVVGLVGKNGAGKSTLLQLVSGTVTPSHGHVQATGRISAILELGAGFNPEFTGLENIHLAMVTAGIHDGRSDESVRRVIEFSGLGEFIQQPLKTYSSGMQVRLAFSVATCVNPDILIVDEALSVGDGEFARRSFDRILQLKSGGATIVLCSHSLFHIEALCSRALWLERGRIVMDAHPHDVIPAYQDFLNGAPLQALLSRPLASREQQGLQQPALQDPPQESILKDEASLLPVASSQGTSARLRRLRFVTDRMAPDGTRQTRSHFAGQTLELHSAQHSLRVQASFDSDLALATPALAVTIHNMDGRIISSAGSWNDGVTLLRDSQGAGTAELCFEAVPLLKGSYTLSVYLFCERGLHIYDNADHVVHLQVTQDGVAQGLFSMPHHWSTELRP